jgi:hypothetical protein
MDASFFFPLAASGCLLAYTLSLFLVIQFRGDYGVMSDYQELRALLWREKHESQLASAGFVSGESVSSNDSNGGGGGSGGNNGNVHSSGKFPGLHNRFGSAAGIGGKAGAMPSSGSPAWSVSSLDWSQPSSKLVSDDSLFAIPLGDISLLFSSMGQGYGSKLYNLKNDFKDV